MVIGHSVYSEVEVEVELRYSLQFTVELQTSSMHARQSTGVKLPIFFAHTNRVIYP